MPGPGERTAVKTKPKVKPPRKFKVLLHNDDYTTMDFVVHVLVSVFNKPTPDALAIMLDVHKRGIGVCGVYTAEVAETKVNAVHDRAREKGFPLRCSMEPE
ncbi:MAG: ATP-dependent Clp protease adapter ClpS [Candidatus Hydrogenedentes bacterium]|nr:ATP-dependent Clp protease adapter ClpS [Candidatus Hydrogenedentota bacterium]